MVAVETERRGLTRRLTPPGRPDSAGLIVRAVGIGGIALPDLDADPAVATARGVVVTGLAGGCGPATAPGDLVLATEIGRTPGGHWTAPDPALSSMARQALRAVGLPHHEGRLLTVEAVVATPDAKAEVWRRHRALAVEMETASVAAWTAIRGLPLLAVRAVADGPADRLPAALFDLVDARGRVRPRALAGLLREPGLAADAWRLWRRSRLALDRLARFLRALAAMSFRP